METLISIIAGPLLKIIDKVIPDTNAREAAKEEIQKALTNQEGQLQLALIEMAKAQAAINQEEAKSPSLFVAGWRPFVGWVCGVGCAYGFIGQPMFTWVSAMFNGPVAPSLDLGSLLSLLFGMLGMSGMRTFEAVKGVKRENLTTSVKR